MVKGYVINLDRHTERLNKFQQHKCARQFEKIPAIDKLNLARIGGDQFFFNTNLLANKINRKVTMGEIACTLSHISCWHKIACNDALLDQDYAIVAEDDIILSDAFDEVVTKLIERINEINIDLKIIILHKLDLYGFSRKMQKNEQYSFITNVSPVDIDNDGSALYLIRKDKAIELVHSLEERKPCWLADHFSTFCPDKIAILYPFLGYIDDSEISDLEEEREMARKEAWY